MNFSCEQQK